VPTASRRLRVMRTATCNAAEREADRRLTIEGIITA
jgi:hypothetical protein